MTTELEEKRAVMEAAKAEQAARWGEFHVQLAKEDAAHKRELTARQALYVLSERHPEGSEALQEATQEHADAVSLSLNENEASYLCRKALSAAIEAAARATSDYYDALDRADLYR